MMRIYLVGAQSTGKTTLLEYISERYNINKLTEVTREVMARYGYDLKEIRSNMDKVECFQRDIMEEQIEREKMTDEPFISDRGFDFLSYTGMYTLSTKEFLNRDYTQEYLESYKDEDSIVIFVRPVKETIKDDGIRDNLNWDNVLQIDAMIKYILESNNIDYITLKSKYLNERIRTIETVMKLGGIR